MISKSRRLGFLWTIVKARAGDSTAVRAVALSLASLLGNQGTFSEAEPLYADAPRLWRAKLRTKANLATRAASGPAVALGQLLWQSEADGIWSVHSVYSPECPSDIPGNRSSRTMCSGVCSRG